MEEEIPERSEQYPYRPLTEEEAIKYQEGVRKVRWTEEEEEKAYREEIPEKA